MDPLSITVSILTLAGAVSATVTHVQTLLDAPKEIIALSNDIADIEVVVQEVASCLSENGASRWTETTQINVSKLLRRAEDKLQRLSSILNDKLLTCRNGNGRRRSVKIAWLKHKSEVEQLRKDLNSVKLSLAAVIGAATSTDIAGILLRLEGISLVPRSVPESSSVVVRQAHRLDGEAGEPEEPPASDSLSVDAPMSTETSIVQRFADGTLLKYMSTDSENIVKIRASTSGCPRWCSCMCHKPSRLQSPRLLNQVLGAVSVGYRGVPFLSSPCNEKMCRPKTKSITNITYQFPAWFLANSISMIITSSTAGPALSLRTWRVLPSTSDVFRFAQSGDLDGIKKLFSKGQASIYDVDGCHWSILHKAFLVGQKEVCQFLLEAGADPYIAAENNTNVIERAWYFDRTNTGRLGSRGNLATVFDQIFKRADMEEFAESQQYTTIHKIVLGLSHLDLAQQLSISTATIDQPDTNGRTALWWAAARGDEVAVRVLLAHGASIYTGSKRSHGVIHVAQTPAVVDSLLEHGARIDSRDEKGRTPLHACCYRGQGRGGDSDLLRCLLKAGADVNARTNAGHTPLHFAAAYGLLEHLPDLLVWGADIESRRHDGFTSLMLAILSNEAQNVKFLLQNGADHTALDSSGRTILHMCALNGNLKTVQTLISAKLDGIDVEARDRHGLTAQHYYRDRRLRMEFMYPAFEYLLSSLRPPPLCDLEDLDGEVEEDFEDAAENLEQMTPDSK